jgi:hypothetical protein
MPSPLSQSPYLSRNESSGHSNAYPLIAFKPGFALQASELNELQEQSLFQQKYTNNFLYDIITGNNTNINPITNDISASPYFVSLNYFSMISPEGIDGSIQIFNTNSNQAISLRIGDFRIWVPGIFAMVTTNLQIGSIQNFYISYESRYELCSSSPSDRGYRFNDNSGSYYELTAGADRFSIDINPNLTTDGTLLVSSIQRTGSTTYVLTDRLNRKKEFTL